MDNTELVKRLRANTEKYPGFQNLNTQAADTIERMERELTAARKVVGAARTYMADWDSMVADPHAACYQCEDNDHQAAFRTALTEYDKEVKHGA